MAKSISCPILLNDEFMSEAESDSTTNNQLPNSQTKNANHR